MTRPGRPVVLAGFVGLLAGVAVSRLGVPLLREVVMLAAFTAAAVIDVRTRRIPNALSLFAVLFGIASASATVGVIAALAGTLLALAAGVLLAAYARGAFGVGDVKLLAAAGAGVGWAGLPALFLVVSLAGGVIALGYALATRRRDATMPYGPAIATGVLWLMLVAR